MLHLPHGALEAAVLVLAAVLEVHVVVEHAVLGAPAQGLAHEPQVLLLRHHFDGEVGLLPGTEGLYHARPHAGERHEGATVIVGVVYNSDESSRSRGIGCIGGVSLLLRVFSS